MQAARRPWHLALYVVALAALVALVAAVSSWAAGDPAPGGQQTATPIQYQAPDAQQGDGDGSGRPPCPEEKGGGQQGGSSQQGSDSTV